MRELVPQFWERRGVRPVGAYWSGLYGHHIVVRLDTAREERQRRLLHELAHYVTHLTYPDAPRWLHEGVSELWEAATFSDRHLKLGAAVERHMKSLRSGKNWIPVAELLSTERVPTTGRGSKAAAFYAQSWLVVHYLVFERGTGLALDRIRAASETLDDEDLRRYVKTKVDGVLRIELPDVPSNCDSRSQRTLAPVEALLVQARALADGERPDAALPFLRRALNLDTKDREVRETLAFVDFVGNRPQQAAAAFDRLIASGEGSYVTYYYRALLTSAVPNLSDGTGSISEIDYLQRAIALAPSFRPAQERLRELTRKEK